MPDTRPTGLLSAHAGQELNLLAGQLYFGREAASVRTLLGSCVSLTLWHPHRRLGGMCHFLLPKRPASQHAALDGRYGEDAITWLMHALQHAGTRPSEYRTGLYGGADTMPDTAGVKFNVGERNIELGWDLIERCGFELHEVDVGDCVPRHVSLSLRDGQVTLRRGPAHASAANTRVLHRAT
jgi:chemotaxis protein CheD